MFFSKKKRRRLEVQKDDRYSYPDNVMIPRKATLRRLRPRKSAVMRNIDGMCLERIMKEQPRLKVELFSHKFFGPSLMIYEPSNRHIYRLCHADEANDNAYVAADDPEERWVLEYSYTNPNKDEIVFPYVRFTKLKLWEPPEELPELHAFTAPWGK